MSCYSCNERNQALYAPSTSKSICKDTVRQSDIEVAICQGRLSHLPRLILINFVADLHLIEGNEPARDQEKEIKILLLRHEVISAHQ